MPVGPYATFDECVAAQKRKGKSEKSAGAICGEIEKRTKKKNEIEDRIFNTQYEMVNEILAKLTTKKRKNLPKSAFAIPEKRAYPIHDRAHAANALARVTQHGTSEEKAIVRRKVCARYPDLPSCKKENKKNEIVLQAIKRGDNLDMIEEILNENTLKSKVEELLAAVLKRWANSGAKKNDIDMFREAVWLFRGLSDEKKGVI